MPEKTIKNRSHFPGHEFLDSETDNIERIRCMDYIYL